MDLPDTGISTRLRTALADRYRLERELGQGGMATVYLAHDLRHEREVAIKVLHPDLGATLGSERFLSEIRTTARLQHPHILPLLDSGEADGLLYYVMPRVRGETLRARIDRERQLPLDDAIRIAREVADALDHAHGHGVIHRDVKPENILLQGGHALVADFGIALAVVQAGGQRLTQSGLSLGTPQYMSPEQAMGERSIDARSDLYALGAVTYEMFAGEPPFTGPTVQAIVAKIMTEKPTPMRVLRDTVPAHIEHAVLKALSKLPADRFASAAQFSSVLASDHPSRPEPAAPAIADRDRIPRRIRALLGAMALVTVAAVGFAAWGLVRRDATEGPSRFVITLEQFYEDAEQGPILSPDDRTFVYDNVKGELLLRHEGSHEPVAVPGASDAWSPFYSPDGSEIAFVTGFPGDLKVVNLESNAIRTLVRDSAIGYGGSWSDDGWLYFTSGVGRAVLRVRPDGGAPELVARVDSARQEFKYRWPDALPDGRGIIMTLWREQGAPDIVHHDVVSGRTRVLTVGMRAWFLPTGHLAVVRPNGVISAMRFDPRAGEITSRAVDLERDVRVTVGGQPIAEVSPKGTLVYGRTAHDSRLIRVNRAGQIAVVDPLLRGQFRSVALSPDGTRAAIELTAGGRGEIWVKTLDDGPFSRAVTAGTYAYRSFWSNDGRSLGFTTDRAGLPQLFAARADGTGRAEPLMRAGPSVDEGNWTADGRWLVYRAGSGAGRDIFGIRLDGDTTPVPLAATADEEYSPAVSPDGRWLVYGSNGSGQDEIYVRPFGSPGDRRFQVSVGGGNEPLWSHSGRELFFRDLSRNLVSVTIAPGDDFRVTGRRVLFSTAGYRQDVRNRAYAVSPDDQSFYFVEQPGAATAGMVVVRNWIEEAERQLGRE